MGKNKSLGNIMDKTTLTRVGATVLGLVGGTVLTSWLNKKNASGETITGLSGATAKYATPAIVGVAGLVCSTMANNQFLKDASIGLASAGAASLTNIFTDRALVSLNGVEPIPGIGSTQQYIQLPSNNEVMNHYNPEKPIGEVSDTSQAIDPNDAPVGTIATPVNLSGVNEVHII